MKNEAYQAIFMVMKVVVSNIFYFHPYLGKIPILTNIFQSLKPPASYFECFFLGALVI